MELIAAPDRPEVQLYVDWNRYEARNADRGYDYREYSQRFVAALEKAGRDYTGGEANDSSGWGGWRSRTDDILAALFPLASVAHSKSK
jgi:hypothetical protein